MKKFKKMLAGLLGAAMVLTSFGTPAWAAGADKMPTIDTKRQGSLTIYKYEYNSAQDATALKDGTGEATDAKNVPKDAKPLAGVEFTIYKIADIEQTTVENGNVKLQYKPIIDGINSVNFNKNVTDYSAVSSAIENAIKNETLNPAQPAAETVLNSDGKTASVTFRNLDLGVYAVKETNAPSQVVNKTANFLVSVPMTNKDGDDWLYDIKAYPKNATVYAGINLVKTGTTIKADGTTETVNLKGVTFALQSRPTGSESSVAWTNVGSYTTESDGTINVNDLAPNDYRFIETGLGKNNGYILNGKPYEFTVQNDGKIKVGSEEPTDIATITADNEKPDLKKEVKKGDTYANAADASIGDMVEWKVSASVPSNVDQLKKYSITDTMSNALTWVEAEAAFTITYYKSNGTAASNITPAFAETNDYTLTKPADNEAGKSWTITFTEAGRKKLKDNNISLIEVTFKTKLNEDAKIGKDGNLNDAQLDYSNAIYPSVDPTNPNNGKTPGEDHIMDQAIVYSFSIDVTKVDGNNNATKLEGVHFDLYKYSGSVESPTESELKGAEGTKIKTDLVTDDKGKITVKGLENGNYYLVETKAAAGGYNLLKAPVKVEIAQKYSVTKNTKVTKDTEGNVTSTTTVVNETFKGGANNSGTYSVTIENRKGFTLPKTGDIGTAMFLIIGICGMLAAVYIMLRGRKRA